VTSNTTERGKLFASEVDELALLVSGEPDAKVEFVLDVVRGGLQDEMDDDLLELLLCAIVRRKDQIERGRDLPVRLQ
jgi:hypothetical protein